MRTNWSDIVDNVRLVRIPVRAVRLVRAALSLAIHNPAQLSVMIQTGLLLLRQRRFEEFRAGLIETIFESGMVERGYRPLTQFSPPAQMDPYGAWLAVNRWNDRCQHHLVHRLQTSSDTLPKISIVVPVYKPCYRISGQDDLECAESGVR